MQEREDHPQCLKSELDLFEGHPVQVSQSSGRWIEYYPTAPVSDGGPISFRIPSCEKYYTDLNSSYMKLRFKIVKENGKPLDSGDVVGPVNLTMHSVFRQIDLFLNDKMITDGTPYYSYRAMLETLVSYGKEAKKTHLQGSLFHKDAAHYMDAVFPADNDGLLKRSRVCTVNDGVSMFGRLHCDMFNQPRYLLTGVDMHIKCIRNSPDFVLMYPDKVPSDGATLRDQGGFRFALSNVVMVMRRVEITPSVRIAHERVLSNNTIAKYPISRVVTTVHSIPSGVQNIVKDDLFHGQVPKRLTCAFVLASALNGNTQLNPYNFKHFNVSTINFLVNDDPVANMNLDFERNDIVDAFVNLFHGTHNFAQDRGCNITYGEFAHGNSIFMFENTPDLSDMKSLYRRGNSKLVINFKEPTTQVISLLLLAEFDSTIEVNKDRAVMTDYAT